MALHRDAERRLAGQDRRTPLKLPALRDRAAACQLLLGQGLLPRQLRALERHGLVLGNPKEPRSLASLVRHLEAYLEGVDGSGYVEPMAALWQAAEVQAGGGRGFWVERHPEDGALEASLRDLAPPRLRALCALPALGTVRFRLATRRGAGRAGLFEGQEPHLVRQLLPTLEALGGLEHLELEAPEGWAENPWGAALDRLFEGPLEGLPDSLQRATMPTESAVWRSAVEQVRAWVDEGFEPAEITLVHPDPAAVGPLLAAGLAAEGIPLRAHPGRSLLESAPWASLWALLTGLRDQDAAPLAAGLASPAETPLGRSLRALAAALDRVDQAGDGALQQAFAALPEGDRRWVSERWTFLGTLREKNQSGTAWLSDLEALAQRLELAGDRAAFYPALGLLEEAWTGERAPMAFPEFLEALEGALEVLRAPDPEPTPGGVRLVSPSALETNWAGSRATLLLDLGEGSWPASPRANPELDWPRLAALNGALRAQAEAGEGARDFPPHLQTFLLPQAEAQEVLPRAFHQEAYGFNRALALTRERLVALSAERDADGQLRAQGPFWRALDGAATWAPLTDAASRGRWRWEAAEPDALTLARQASLRGGPAPDGDHLPGLWLKGLAAETPLAPTLLEGLARCPFRVFGERHLKLRAEGEAHALHLGTLAHGLLETMLRGLENAPHWPAAFLEREGVEGVSTAAMEAILQARWDATKAEALDALEPLGASERSRLVLAMEELLPALAEVLAQDLASEAPTAEEAVHLGLAEGGAWRRELLGLEWALEPRETVLPAGRRIWIHGTVDRLERWSRGPERFLRIVDYKTSRYARLSEYREGALGAHLQLPLYQAMVEEVLGLPATALLVSLRETGKPVPMMLKGEDRAALRANLEALLDRALRGEFPACPGEHCDTCGLSALCGRPVDIDVPSEEAE